MSGESADVDEHACEDWKNNILPDLIRPYYEKGIFNADEAALFCKCLPDKTLTFKNEKCFWGKHSKERITLMIGTNMYGAEKLKPLVIGKSRNPRCFKEKRFLPVTYKVTEMLG